MTVSDPSGNVSAVNLMAVANNYALEEISPYLSPDSDIDASVVIGTAAAAQTLSITIESTDADECLRIANEAASETVARAQAAFQALQEANEAGLADLSVLSSADDLSSILSGSLLQDALGTGRTFEFCTFLLNEAVEPERAGFGIGFLLAVGCVLGLLVAVAAVMILDVVKQPIRNRKDIEEVVELPILYVGAKGESGARLWANLQFAGDAELASICLVPLSEGYVDECAASLRQAIDERSSAGGSPVVAACPPVVRGVEAVYCAHESSATVLCACRWTDSRKGFRETMDALKLAHADVAGVVLLSA